MARKRLPINAGLPKRWRFKNNAYYYVPVEQVRHLWDNKKLFRLGKSLSEAHKAYAERAQSYESIKTIAELLHDYQIKVIPTKRPKTQTNNIKALEKLMPVFGNMLIHDIRPKDIYHYRYERITSRKQRRNDNHTGERSAKMETDVLSHAFTKAVEWGLLDRHPFKGEVRFKSEGPKQRRYIEDEDIALAFSLEPRSPKDWVTRMMRAYVRLKYITGLRMTDMLMLKPQDLKPDGLHVTPQKTQGSSGKRIVIEPTEALVEAFNEALAARPVHIAPTVFCTRRGASYFNEETGNAYAFYSLWQRWMKRVVELTGIDPFRERDIRAKTGSDIKNLGDASALLGHTDTRTTSKHYRRRPEIVKPLR